MPMSSLCCGSSYSVELGAGVGVGDGVGVGFGVGVGVGFGFLVGLPFLEVGFALASISSSRLFQLTQLEGVPRDIWSLCFGGVGLGVAMGVGLGVGVGFGVDFGVEDEVTFGVEVFFDLVFGGFGVYSGFLVVVGLLAKELVRVDGLSLDFGGNE